MKKMLITGGSGLLGSNIAKLAKLNFDVYATYNNNQVTMESVNYFRANIIDNEILVKIKDIKPDTIIHCAALTDIDYCEENPDEAYMLNTVATMRIVEAAKEIGAYLIYISTDSVFDGSEGNYSENDITNPINVYGKTKLKAEEGISSIFSNFCIVRTNIYGWNKIGKFSIAEWMLNRLFTHQELPGLKDIFFSPIFVNHLIDMLFYLQDKRYKGIIHIAAKKACSKLEFAYMIANVFQLNKEYIKPISIDDLNLKAKRGKDLSLNITKIEEISGRFCPSIENGLRTMKMLDEAGYTKELKG
jgi:dTDP-4-dehydrorhamnose reductase